MEINLIIKNKSTNLNNREKFKICENYKNVIFKKSEKISENKIKIYFYKGNRISLLSNIFALFIIFIHISFSKKMSRNLNANNDIILRVKGLNEYKPVLTNNIQRPNKILVNGKEHNGSIISFNLTESENTIILSWETFLTSCESMFNNLDYIFSIDLSNFNSSKVTSMSNMFSGCSGLKTINFNNLDTSSVIYMDYMFLYCTSLVSLDLSNFNTSSVVNMQKMFYSCISLVSIDLSSFNTSIVENMDYMFSNDYSLISLDLSNFNISSLKSLKGTFDHCKSLIYINLIPFVEIDAFELNDIFPGVSNNLISCIDENNAPKIANYIKTSNINNDCNNICFKKSRKIIIEKKKCIDECNNDDVYVFEYNNFCYDSEEKINNRNSDYISNSVIDEITENNKISQYIEIINKTEEEENESTNKVEENKSTNKVEENEGTNKVKENESTNKVKENESTNKVEENEGTNKVEENESTNKVEENESTNKVEENESTNKV